MKQLLLVFFAMLTICSCGDDIEKDGDWSQMKWVKTDYPTVKDGESEYVSVPKEGGTYVFLCTNYMGFWLSNSWFEVDGKVKYMYEDAFDNPDYEPDPHHYSNEWIDIKAKDGGVLEVVFQPNTGSERKAGVGVTAGNIFHSFEFIQSAGE